MSTRPEKETRYILEMMTVHSDMIRILFESLKDVLTDVNFIFDSTGLKVAEMDGSHVAYVHMKLDADKIRLDGHYYCPRKVTVGVNMGNIFKLVKTVTKDDTISLFIEKDNPNVLGIKIDNAHKNYVSNFKLQILDIDITDFKLPNIEFNSIITMPSQDFQKYCRDMSNLSEVLDIKSIDSQIILSCDGDFASQEIIIGESNSSLIEFDNGGKDDIIQGRFSLKFLTTFTKATNLCSSIKMYIKNDFPLLLEYSIANLGSIKFVLSSMNTGNTD